MSIVCNKKILINKIGAAQKAVNNKSVMEPLKCLLLNASNGKLSITGYDMDLAIEATMEAEVNEDYKFIVDSRLFGEIVRKLSEETVTLEVLKDENKVKITSGNTKYKLTLGELSEYPELPNINIESSFSINSKILKNMIAKTSISLSFDQTKPILTGALLEIEKDSVSMVAIDGYRMSISKENFNTETKDSFKVVIPGKALNTVSSVIGSNDEDITISFGDRFMITSFEDITYTARLLEGEFIEYQKLLPNTHQTEIKINRKKLLDTVDRMALVVSNEKNNLIKLAITDTSLQAVSNSDIVDSADSVDIEKTGDSLNIAFNSKYLMEALKVISSDDVIIRFNNNVTPCTIYPVDSDNYIYLLLPVRVSN